MGVVLLAAFVTVRPVPAAEGQPADADSTAAPQTQKASQLNIDEMFIQLWPEYDQPALLTIVEARILTGQGGEAVFVTAQDARLESFELKKAGAEIQTAGVQPQFDNTEAGKKLIVPVKDADYLRIEYYSNFKLGEQEVRDFRARITMPGRVKSLTVLVQRPKKATEFQLEGAAPGVSQDDQGYEYHSLNGTDLTPGQLVQPHIVYRMPVATDTGGAEEGEGLSTAVAVAVGMFVLAFAVQVAVLIRRRLRVDPEFGHACHFYPRTF